MADKTKKDAVAKGPDETEPETEVIDTPKGTMRVPKKRAAPEGAALLRDLNL